MEENSSQPEIQVVLFDAAGTLFELREPVGNTYARFASRAGISVASPSTIESAFRIEFKSMPPMRGPGMDWWRELVLRTFASAGSLPKSGLPESLFLELFENFGDSAPWRLFPETLETLETLKARGFRLGLLSNFDERVHRVLKGLGIEKFFEFALSSAEAGAAKPDRRIFDAVVALFRVPPGSCLHAGDDPIADWMGAREAGLQAFKLDRRRNDLRALLDKVCTAD